MASAVRRTACTSVTSSGQAKPAGWACKNFASPDVARRHQHLCTLGVQGQRNVARPMPLDAPTSYALAPPASQGGFKAMVLSLGGKRYSLAVFS